MWVKLASWAGRLLLLEVAVPLVKKLVLWIVESSKKAAKKFKLGKKDRLEAKAIKDAKTKKDKLDSFNTLS